MRYPYTDLSIAKNLLILDVVDDVKDLITKLNVRIEQLETLTKDFGNYNTTAERLKEIELLLDLKRCRKYCLYVMACYNLEIRGGER